MSNIEHNSKGVTLHIGRPESDTFVQESGPFAGLRMKLLGSGGLPVRNLNVQVVHHAPSAPVYFDPSHVKQAPPDPSAAAAAVRKDAAPVARVVEVPVATEVFTTSTPTVSNVFADLQAHVIDEDEAPVADPDEIQTVVLDGEETLVDVLLARPLTEYGLTKDEFSSLGLSKRQFWKLYEQVIGKVTNKPHIAQAVDTILRKANANAADYTRVVQGVKRVLESA